MLTSGFPSSTPRPRTDIIQPVRDSTLWSSVAVKGECLLLHVSHESFVLLLAQHLLPMLFGLLLKDATVKDAPDILLPQNAILRPDEEVSGEPCQQPTVSFPFQADLYVQLVKGQNSHSKKAAPHPNRSSTKACPFHALHSSSTVKPPLLSLSYLEKKSSKFCGRKRPSLS